MKKIALLFLFLFFGSIVHSQVLISMIFGDKLNSDGMEFGLEGGFNYSSISGMNSNDRISAFNIGFYFDIRLKDQWYLDTGVLVKSKQGLDKLSNEDLLFLGVEIHPEEGNYEQVVKNFLVPVQLKYKFNNYWYLEGGVQFGLVTKAYVEFNTNESGQEIRIREKNRDMINRFDVGAIGGFGYQLMKGKGMTIGAKYYYGFIDVYKEKSGTKHNTFFLKVNIAIGANKAKAKAAEKEKNLNLQENDS